MTHFGSHPTQPTGQSVCACRPGLSARPSHGLTQPRATPLPNTGTVVRNLSDFCKNPTFAYIVKSSTRLLQKSTLRMRSAGVTHSSVVDCGMRLHIAINDNRL